MDEKDKRKNQPPNNMHRSWQIFGFWILMSFLVVLVWGWVVFANTAVLLVWSITILSGISVLFKLVRYYYRTFWILAAIPLTALLFFACGMVFYFTISPLPRTCQLENLSVAKCGHEYRGLICYEYRNHFFGLIFVEKEVEKPCGTYFGSE